MNALLIIFALSFQLVLSMDNENKSLVPYNQSRPSDKSDVLQFYLLKKEAADEFVKIPGFVKNLSNVPKVRNKIERKKILDSFDNELNKYRENCYGVESLCILNDRAEEKYKDFHKHYPEETIGKFFWDVSKDSTKEVLEKMQRNLKEAERIGKIAHERNVKVRVPTVRMLDKISTSNETIFKDNEPNQAFPSFASYKAKSIINRINKRVPSYITHYPATSIDEESEHNRSRQEVDEPVRFRAANLRLAHEIDYSPSTVTSYSYTPSRAESNSEISSYIPELDPTNEWFDYMAFREKYYDPARKEQIAEQERDEFIRFIERYADSRKPMEVEKGVILNNNESLSNLEVMKRVQGVNRRVETLTEEYAREFIRSFSNLPADEIEDCVEEAMELIKTQWTKNYVVEAEELADDRSSDM
jgi:hypothetical protein